MITINQLAKKKGVNHRSAWIWVKRHVPKNRIVVAGKTFLVAEKDVKAYFDFAPRRKLPIDK